jgi:hypothetical protein
MLCVSRTSNSAGALKTYRRLSLYPIHTYAVTTPKVKAPRRLNTAQSVTRFHLPFHLPPASPPVIASQSTAPFLNPTLPTPTLYNPNDPALSHQKAQSVRRALDEKKQQTTKKNSSVYIGVGYTVEWTDRRFESAGVWVPNVTGHRRCLFASLVSLHFAHPCFALLRIHVMQSPPKLHPCHLTALYILHRCPSICPRPDTPRNCNNKHRHNLAPLFLYHHPAHVSAVSHILRTFTASPPLPLPDLSSHLHTQQLITSHIRPLDGTQHARCAMTKARRVHSLGAEQPRKRPVSPCCLRASVLPSGGSNARSQRRDLQRTYMHLDACVSLDLDNRRRGSMEASHSPCLTLDY